MSSQDHKIFSTTADIGIKVRGEDIESLIKNSMKGFSILLGKFRKKIQIKTIEKTIKINFDSYESLTVKILNELLYLNDVENLNLIDIIDISFNNNIFIGNLLFGKIQNNNFIFKESIKSVTYHNIKIIKKRKYYYISIIMDI